MKYNIGIVVLAKGIESQNGKWHSNLDAQINLAAAIMRYKRYQREGLKPFLVLSGGKIDLTAPSLAEVMYKEAVGFGIPAKDIFTEDKSIDTTENAEFSKPIINENLSVDGRLEVITNHYHLKRAQTCFKIQDLNPLMASSESELLIPRYSRQVRNYLNTKRIKDFYKKNRRWHVVLKLLGAKPFRWYLHRKIKKEGKREP